MKAEGGRMKTEIHPSSFILPLRFGGLLGDDGFRTPGQFAAGQHHLTATGQTFDFQIRAEAKHPPSIATTRVRFPQTEMVIQL